MKLEANTSIYLLFLKCRFPAAEANITRVMIVLVMDYWIWIEYFANTANLAFYCVFLVAAVRAELPQLALHQSCWFLQLWITGQKKFHINRKCPKIVWLIFSKNLAINNSSRTLDQKMVISGGKLTKSWIFGYSFILKHINSWETGAGTRNITSKLEF